jgi:hypothetical protein
LGILLCSKHEGGGERKEEEEKVQGNTCKGRGRVKRWKVKKVKRWELVFVMCRGTLLRMIGILILTLEGRVSKVLKMQLLLP